MPPLWGFGYLVYAVFYKTCRPSGAKCGTICGASIIVGERFTSPDGLGKPNPYGFNRPPSFFFPSSAFFAPLRPCVKLSFDSCGFADGFSLFTYHASRFHFPLKLWLPLLHETPACPPYNPRWRKQASTSCLQSSRSRSSGSLQTSATICLHAFDGQGRVYPRWSSVYSSTKLSSSSLDTARLISPIS